MRMRMVCGCVWVHMGDGCGRGVGRTCVCSLRVSLEPRIIFQASRDEMRVSLARSCVPNQ